MKHSGMNVILIVIGGLLVLDTAVVSFLSNFNLGVILPGLLGLPLLLLGFFRKYTQTGVLHTLRTVLTVCYGLALAMFIVCGILMFSACHEKPAKETDTLIVLGAALHGEKVTWVLSNRLDTAAEYLLAHPQCACVTSGGQGSGEDLPEGEAMRNYLIRAGVEAERIFEETASASTEENFRFSRVIAEKELGTDRNYAFVTTDFHVFRAGRTAKKLGIDAVGIPAPDVWYIRINNFMRECVGICYYALMGRL